MLVSVIVFYSEDHIGQRRARIPQEEATHRKKRKNVSHSRHCSLTPIFPSIILSRTDTELRELIVQEGRDKAKDSNMPVFGRGLQPKTHQVEDTFRPEESFRKERAEKRVLPVELRKESNNSYSPKAALKLKSVCCEKYKKGKRCKRCPCFDLLKPEQE